MGVRYSVGIDVGQYSIGFAAVEVDDVGAPIRVLNMMSLVHDSGVLEAKTATTRLAASGLARRTRRLMRRRRKRLRQLDVLLNELGWGKGEESRDPYAPWKARAELAAERVDDDNRRADLLGIAMRHIARHRGWRNPYSTFETLQRPSEPSDQMRALRERVAADYPRPLPDDLTPGQLVALSWLTPSKKLRGEGGRLGERLLQTDNATEIWRICEVQGVDLVTTRRVIEAVFKAESPKGAQVGRVGKDPLNGKPRAAKASEAFQRYRMVSLVANLRVRQQGEAERPLTGDERSAIVDYLMTVKPTVEPSWADVAEQIGITRDQLRGTATTTADGDRASARPPLNNTDRIVRGCGVKKLVEWWVEAPTASREALIDRLSNGASSDPGSDAEADADELMGSLEDEDILKLDSLHLPAGRAAYSMESLLALTERMLATEDDLHAARKAVFGVDDDWRPPVEPIGSPVGNPAVDRVLKGVARWLALAEKVWGPPERVVIEHVRSGFVSEAAARDIDRDNNRRHEQNRKRMEELRQRLNVSGELRRSDLVRLEAIERQNGQCLYCGTGITFRDAEMDHIVPQAGVGSTNTRENLAAVCSRCNRSKSNKPFAAWAAEVDIPGVSLAETIERTRHFPVPPGSNRVRNNKFIKAVQERLRRTSPDDEIDARSLESVAWMANELRQRVEGHFKDAGTAVEVYRGQLTAEARRASGIADMFLLIGGAGKTRLDRRHHAVDAAVITMTDPSVARTLAQRVNLRDAQRYERAEETWREHFGDSPAAVEKFLLWKQRMGILAELINEELTSDRVAVTQNLRLRLGNGAAHDDTIRKLAKRKVGEAMSAELIDRAATPALWTALTRCHDFDAKEGLPENWSREIRVNGTTFDAVDEVGFFGGSAAAIAVRGGYAEIGSTIHHARIFRIDGGKKPVYAMLRVFAVDLQRYRDQDLFSAPIPPQSISWRTAEPRLREAVAEGRAAELGWLVVGDELNIDMSGFQKGQVGDFLAEYPGTTRWRVDGINAPVQVRLRPAEFSAEGLSAEPSPAEQKMIDRPGWRPQVNVLFGASRIEVVRRDALGRPRQSGRANLPACWSVEN